MARVVRHLVLDSEAASVLLSTGNNKKRAAVAKAIAAATGKVVVPTTVRVEVGWDRTASNAADANRLVPSDADFPLDAAGADRAAQLRAAVPRVSVVDATVAAAAEVLGAGGGVVEVLTSDAADMSASSAYVRGALVVVHL